MVTKDMGSAGRVNLKGVHKSFLLSDGEELEVLKGIDLEIRPREMFSLIGPSGCGKTTLLRLIAGLDIPSSGMVTVDDQPINGPDCKRAFMSQDPNLFPWLNVKRNISFGLEARKKRDGISKDVSKQKISELINMVGLSGFESVYPHQLSGGMAQRVALARALANEPTVLLLDEPLGSLDAFTKMALQDQLLRVWQEKRKTIIFVTHDIEEAVYLADRVAIMSPRPGQIEEVIEVPLGRPRDRMDLDFLRIKEKIYAKFRLKIEKPFVYQI